MDDIEILISTMHQTNEAWLQKINPKTDAVVINQGDAQGEREFAFASHRILWLDTKERGLSRSRNQALQAATADYVMLADDDMEYLDNYPNTVRAAFEVNPRVDIIAFQVEGIGMTFKNYAPKVKKIGYLSSMHLSSVELAFRRESVIKKGLRFHEQFGSGAQYKMGEENIFLFDALRAGLRILYVPVKIARLHVGVSTWFQGYNEKYFHDRGATYRKMFGAAMGVPMLLLFAIKKRNLLRGNITMGKALSCMWHGFCEYGKIDKSGKEK